MYEKGNYPFPTTQFFSCELKHSMDPVERSYINEWVDRLPSVRRQITQTSVD